MVESPEVWPIYSPRGTYYPKSVTARLWDPRGERRLIAACGSVHFSPLFGKQRVSLGGPRTTEEERVRQEGGP